MLAALLSAVAGCAVDENKDIARYRAILDGRQLVRVEYRAGEPLTLPAALLLANQGNENLALQGENYVQALLEKQRAASAFFPTITLVPSYSKADASSDAGGLRLQGAGGTQDENAIKAATAATGDGRWDTPVNLNVNVFRGFRDAAAVGRSAAEIRRNRHLLLDLQASVLLDVARTYYQVLRAERTAQVLEVSAKTQDARVGEMRMKDVIGAAQKLDVAQIEAQAAATRATLIAARNDVRSARVLLAFLVNTAVADAPLVDKLDVPATLNPAGVFLSLAKQSREDLRAAESAVEAARQNVQIAFGQYYPAVSVNLNYYFQRQSPPSDSDWNALLSFSLPLFTGGRINADHRIALSQLRQAKLNESLLTRQIEQDVLLAHGNLDASTRRLEELRIGAEAAQTALEVAEGRYKAGLGTYLERLIAQDRQLSAQLDFASEEYNRKILYLNLLRIAGQLQRPADPASLSLTPVVTPSGSPNPAATGPSEPAAMTRPVIPATVPSRETGGTGTVAEPTTRP